jgi:replicative DNA helicase
MSVPEKTVSTEHRAEEAVLGALLMIRKGSPRSAVPPFRAFLPSEAPLIYETVVILHERREPVDFLTLTTELNGASSWSRSVERPTSHSSSCRTLRHQCGKLRADGGAHLRSPRLLDAAGDIARFAYDEDAPINEVVDQSEMALFAISQQRATRVPAPIQEVVQNDTTTASSICMRIAGNRWACPAASATWIAFWAAFSAPITDLSRASRCGKTSLMLTLALKAAEKGRMVSVFSLEMSAEQLAQRMVAG